VDENKENDGLDIPSFLDSEEEAIDKTVFRLFDTEESKVLDIPDETKVYHPELEKKNTADLEVNPIGGKHYSKVEEKQVENTTSFDYDEEDDDDDDDRFPKTPLIIIVLALIALLLAVLAIATSFKKMHTTVTPTPTPTAEATPSPTPTPTPTVEATVSAEVEVSGQPEESKGSETSETENNQSETTQNETNQQASSEAVIATYVLNASMNVRVGPGTDNAKVDNANIPAAYSGSTDGSMIVSGTTIQVYEIYKDELSIWARIGDNAWVCLEDENQVYATEQ